MRKREILNQKSNPINQLSHIQININATLLEAISKIETNKLKSCFVADKHNKIIGVLVDKREFKEKTQTYKKENK